MIKRIGGRTRHYPKHDPHNRITEKPHKLQHPVSGTFFETQFKKHHLIRPCQCLGVYIEKIQKREKLCANIPVYTNGTKTTPKHLKMS